MGVAVGFPSFKSELHRRRIAALEATCVEEHRERRETADRHPDMNAMVVVVVVAVQEVKLWNPAAKYVHISHTSFPLLIVFDDVDDH